MLKFFDPVAFNTPSYYIHLAAGVLLVLAILTALQAAPRQYRKAIIALFTFLGGIYYVADFFEPTSVINAHPKLNLDHYNDLVANISNVIGGWAIGLGVFSLLQLHTRNIVRAVSGWGNSAALIVSFLAMFVFGLLDKYDPGKVLLHIHGIRMTNDSVFQFLFTGGLSNFGAAMFSMIAFFIASAAYRAFRIRSLESSFLMTAALIVMLGSVSFGTMLTNWLPLGTDPRTDLWANFRIENIAQWLLLEVNAPAQRGIIFGLSLGGLAMALRIWLSLERGAYFDKEI